MFSVAWKREMYVCAQAGQLEGAPCQGHWQALEDELGIIQALQREQF